MAIAKPTDAINRIRQANGNPYDAVNNPGGLAEGGHRQNFVPDLNANVDVALWGETLAIDAEKFASDAAKSLTDTKAEAGRVSSDIKAAIASDVQAAQDARTGAELAASETADDLRAAFSADVTASQAARKGAEDARDATALIRDAAAGSARDADASARAAAASAQSVDGPAIAASIASARRYAYDLNLHYGA